MTGYDDTTPDTTEIYTFFGQPGFKLYNSTMFSTPKNSTQASVSYSTVIVQGPKSKSTTPSPSLRDDYDNDKYLLVNSERPNDKFCQDCKQDNEIRDESDKENRNDIKAPWPFTVPR